MTADLEDARKLVDSVDHWYHRIEVAPGLVTPGVQDSPAMLEALDLPEDLSGLRVLDIGTRDGFFAFECERRGGEVTAIDYATPNLTGFEVARELLGCEVEFTQENVYNLAPDQHGEFDLVLFLGVLYHLRNPMLALDAIRGVTPGRLILETQMIDEAFLTAPEQFRKLSELNPELEAIPLMQFYPEAALNGDPTSKWAPNEACLRGMLEEAGFAVESVLRMGPRGLAFARAVDDPKREYLKALDSSVGMWGAEAPAHNEHVRDDGGVADRSGGGGNPGSRSSASGEQSDSGAPQLPMPPPEMRRLVGPTDPGAFDNPSRNPVYPELPSHAYESVFDFGCGCGRLARKLIQQDPPPRRYLGVDVNPELIRWCQENLSTHAPGFEFRHHDVAHAMWNPGPGKPQTTALDAADGSFTLVLAHSIFTHLIEPDAEFYLSEVARILSPTGVLASTWFLFDKGAFPMMQEFQHALYINHEDPTNAVIFDRAWLMDAARRRGLTVFSATLPAIRGHQWYLYMTPARAGVEEIVLPPEESSLGTARVDPAPASPS